MRTVKISVGSGINEWGRGPGDSAREMGFYGQRDRLPRRRYGVGGKECPPHTVSDGSELQRGGKVGGDAGGFFGGGEHPLIEGRANTGALSLILDDDEAQEAVTGGEACAHGVGTGEHAVQGEGHVVIFGELEDGEHAAFPLNG